MSTELFPDDENAFEDANGTSLIDCDVHPTFKRGLRDLAPYLSKPWQVRFGITEAGAGTDMFGGVRESTIEMPKSPFFTPSPGGFRKDACPPNGGPPGSDPQFVASHHMDRYKVDHALLLGQPALTLASYPNPDVACVIASAYNDWLDELWLSADDRYCGAIAIAPQDVGRAVAEIERVASRPGFVAIFLPIGQHMLGDPYYYPIYEAAERHGLPITLHISGVEGTFTTSPAYAGGVPATYFEYKTCVTGVYQANLVSLVVRGVLDRFPQLRVLMVECGIAWLVELLWRLDTNWKALRDEVPWVTRPPSEIIFDRVRFTSQPFVEPPTKKQLRDFCEMVRIEEILLFASDYPHYDFDDPLRVLNSLPKNAQQAVRYENASRLFGDRLEARTPSLGKTV